MDYRDFYKSRGNFSLSDHLAKRYQNVAAERQEKQRELFWGSRIVLDEPESPKPEPTAKPKNPRLEMLKKWKAEKMKKLEEEKKNQKPVFKVGIVQKKATGSPLISKPKIYLKKNVGTQQTCIKPQTRNTDVHKAGVLTRAKAKALAVKSSEPEIKTVNKSQKKFNNKFCKIETGKKKQIDSHVFKVPEAVSKLMCNNLTVPYSPKCSKQRTLKLHESEVEVKKAKTKGQIEEVAAQMIEKLEIKKAGAENPVKEAVQVEAKVDAEEQSKETTPESKREVTLEPKNTTPEKTGNEQDDFRPIYYSPYVTVRSGKKSKRKSQKKSLILDVEEQIKKEENEFKCRIFSFRKYIECETKRLLETCDKWKHIYLDFQEVPTDVEGDIDSVIGKTNLLTSDKFIQFKGLIDRCENNDPFVKIDDLQGFQDWVSIEVERIDEEFHKLEKRKCNNWESETPPVEVAKTPKVKVAKNGLKKPVGKSNIRSHILAARKLLKEGNANGGEGFQLPTLATDPTEKVTTPKKEQSLLKDVLTSGKKNRRSLKKSPARERRNSGLEIMIATHKNKLLTPVEKSPVVTDYKVIIEREETPSRSILKKTPKTLSSSKGRVTFKKLTENVVTGGKGLSEKYFQPLMDDDISPLRTVLGDLGNLTPLGMKTRSRTKQMAHPAALMSPQVN